MDFRKQQEKYTATKAPYLFVCSNCICICSLPFKRSSHSSQLNDTIACSAAAVVFNGFLPDQSTVSETAEPILLMQKDEANNKNEQRETNTNN